MTDKAKLEKIKKLADAMYYAAFNLTTDASLLRKAMNEYHQFIIHEYCKEEPIASKVLEDMLNAKTAAESLGISPEEHDKIVDECLYGKEPELVDVDDLPNKKEEPVSEELEEVAETYALDDYIKPWRELVKRAFKAGAKWQKTKDESTTEDLGEYINELSKQFPEVSFAKLSRIAVRVAKWQKEQMMSKAVDSRVYIDAGGYPYIPQMELYDYDKDVPLAKAGEKYKVVLIKED